MKNILIIDDDPEMVMIARKFLEFAGYHVMVEPNGTRAVETATTKKPDAIILDVHMPKVSGIALFEDLRKCEDTTRIPVILTSCNLMNRQKAELHGVKHFLDKPLDPSTLLATINQIVA